MLCYIVNPRDNRVQLDTRPRLKSTPMNGAFKYRI